MKAVKKGKANILTNDNVTDTYAKVQIAVLKKIDFCQYFYKSERK